ncbi:hypothetical protein C8J57DRAFT_1278071 [Mycena rebaudengoi]|nr:hypothetical protein C8J57DRAFT_1278071 [Mycena rebaudengoi]
MSFFNHAHGVNIHGGQFYNLVNVEPEHLMAIQVNQQNLVVAPDYPNREPPTLGASVGDGLTNISHGPASGVQRTIRSIGGVRQAPYNVPNPPYAGSQMSAYPNHGSVAFSESRTFHQAWPYSSAFPGEFVPNASSSGEENAENSSRSLRQHLPESYAVENSASFPSNRQGSSDSAFPPPHSSIAHDLPPQHHNGPYTSADLDPVHADPNFFHDDGEHLGEHMTSRTCIPPQRSAQFGATTNIHGGAFYNNVQSRGEKGIDKLHAAVALEALHDSAESFPQPRCHPETRTKMLDDLLEWSLETDLPSRILWLHGPAGAGKSAIMQTFSRRLQDASRLGGCFFFKRAHATRGNGKTLFATIAYQLALGVHWLKALISQIVEDDPSLVARSIETQLQRLICDPCRLDNDNHEDQDPLTILIDGLDECEGQDVQQEILRAIRNTSSTDSLPLRFIIASRPESHIREVFDSSLYQGACRRFNVEQSFDDVRKYLCDEFARIYREHRETMAAIPQPWPLPDVLNKLVEKSSGYFIYASTIIKFIDDKNYRPTKRLSIITHERASESAFDALDELYMKVLSTAPQRPQLLPALCAITNFDLRPSVLDQLLKGEPGDSRLLLRSLHSVVNFPPESEPMGEISVHHASFRDFLVDPRRSQAFYVGGLQHRMHLARTVLKIPGFADQDYFLSGYQVRSLRRGFTPFVISLPPSAELLPLIHNINPNYLFSWGVRYIQEVLSWIKRIGSAPYDLINLWEDYVYMNFFVETLQDEETDWPPPNEHAHRILLQIPGLISLLQLTLLWVNYRNSRLGQIQWLLDVSWNDLRKTICALRPSVGTDQDTLRELCTSLHHPSVVGEPFPWPSWSLSLARRCVRLAKDYQTGEVPDETIYWVMVLQLPIFLLTIP